ncbi:MAG: nucleotidyl transferase AbiEii/AbiGii toxin family protein [Acidobacteria bacterium]|nr:nucleotidyl transferase AbiEii/AbiGii toxin family protein [Acidobacteriota bacterium]
MTGKLTPLQRRILCTLAALDPPWTLTGGGALAGVHLGHRTTRDLDLFWRARSELGPAPADAQVLLRAAGLGVVALRTTPAFAELRVSDGHDVCIVDLVAEPFPPVEAPLQTTIEEATIAVDSMHEILVAKLTALLSRMELRDLIDVRALLEAGADLTAAVRDAPKKDTGFSALTLAWVLHTFEAGPLARAMGWSEKETAGIDAWRRQLVDRLTRMTRPA